MRIPTSTEEEDSFSIEEEYYDQKNKKSVTAKLNLAWNFFVSAVQAKDIRHQYDRMTEQYFDLFGDSQAEYAQVLTRFSLSLEDLKRNDALDLGAGSGILTLPISRYFDDVQAVDFSLNMLNHGKSQMAEGVTWSQADVCHLPFRSDSFDLVISSGLITHILPDSFDQFVKEMVRVCRKGGHIVVGVPPMPWRRLIQYRCPMNPNQLDHVIGFWYNLFHKALGMNESRCGYSREKVIQVFKKYEVDVRFEMQPKLGLIHGQLK